MHRFLLTLFFISAFQAMTFAQYEYGTYFIDGNVNFDKSKQKMDDGMETELKSTSLKLIPEFGYFIKNNLAIGIGVCYVGNLNVSTMTTYASYPGEKYTATVSPTLSTALYEVAPSLFIKYFYQCSKKLSFSLKGSYSKGWGTNQLIQKYSNYSQVETVLLSQKNKIESTYYSLSPELQYLIGSKVGLQLNFNGLNYVSSARYHHLFQLDLNDPKESTTGTYKESYQSISFNIKPEAWSVGVFVLLN